MGSPISFKRSYDFVSRNSSSDNTASDSLGGKASRTSLRIEPGSMPLEERLRVNLAENTEVELTTTAPCATHFCLISQSSVTQAALAELSSEKQLVSTLRHCNEQY